MVKGVKELVAAHRMEVRTSFAIVVAGESLLRRN